MILTITFKEITFWNGNLIYVSRNVSFTFDFKKLNILPCSADFIRMDIPMMLEV